MQWDTWAGYLLLHKKSPQTPVWAGNLYTYATPLPPGQPGAVLFEGLARQSLHPRSPVWLLAELGPHWLLVGGRSQFIAQPLGRAHGFHLSAVPCSAWHFGFSERCLVIQTLNSSCKCDVCMLPVASDIKMETLLYPAVAPTTPGMRAKLLLVPKAVMYGLVTLPQPCWTLL